MRKWTKTLGAMVLTGLMVVNLGVTANAAVKTEESPVAPASEASLHFTAIIECGRLLSLENSWGKMYVLGYTDTYYDYTAGVKVELQKKNGSDWDPVASWEDIHGSSSATIREYYTVNSRGTYRTKVTHTGYELNGTLIETFIEYSDEVTY